jgi:hypothetical protein
LLSDTPYADSGSQALKIAVMHNDVAAQKATAEEKDVAKKLSNESKPGR